jgi:hypothetical protein
MSKMFRFRATPRNYVAIETIIRLWPDVGYGPLNQTEAVQLALHELAERMHKAEHEKKGTEYGIAHCSICRDLNN